MFQKVSYLLVAVCSLIAVVQSQAPPTIECGAHESTCLVHLFETDEKSLRCYNSNTHTCKQNLLCPIESPARCGDSCYAISADGFVCHQNLYLCPMALPELCGSTCYNKDSYECTNDFLVEI